MEPCRGFTDWLECLQCPHLCTKLCPIESADVMEAMGEKIRISSVPGIKLEGE